LRNFYEICRKNADEFDEIDEAFLARPTVTARPDLICWVLRQGLCGPNDQ